MLKQNIEILISHKKEGMGKSGKPYSMIISQCIVRDDVGDIQVGELTLPRDTPEPAPGHYEAEFKIGVDYQTKKIGGVLVGLKPLTRPTVSPPKSHAPS